MPRDHAGVASVSLCPSLCVRLSICVCGHVCLCMYMCLQVYMSLCPHRHLSICLCVSCVYLVVPGSVCLHVYVLTPLCIFIFLFIGGFEAPGPGAYCIAGISLSQSCQQAPGWSSLLNCQLVARGNYGPGIFTAPATISTVWTLLVGGPGQGRLAHWVS